MATMFCKTCGGATVREGNYDVCEFCGNRWERVDEGTDSELALDLSRAWAALRDGTFEVAAELFEQVLEKSPTHHEAHWGRALAQNGILYVTDYNEKKVPTCNNITENSFTASRDVKMAIENAPADIARGYRQQAAYIEAVRAEWLEKAQKEPPYDVFISFKDSDRENGIERTQDSIDAQDLYLALTEEGYRVFFSRVSLRDKVAEHYEPYIYNALKTAKVMIVFGEKPEYFNAVWVKNEWRRFQGLIKKGEKHPHSLVVVYKNMAPADLPYTLQARQCLNAADMTFLHNLFRHVGRVITETKPKNVASPSPAPAAAAEDAAKKAAAERAAREAAAKKAAAEKAAREAAAKKAAAKKATRKTAKKQNTVLSKIKQWPKKKKRLIFGLSSITAALLVTFGIFFLYDNITDSQQFSIPAGTTIISADMLEGYKRITSITIPASVTSIGDEAFYGCKKLKTVTFEENSKLTSIGTWAFSNCKGLTSITIPASVTSIGPNAFWGCKGLTSITIPASVTSIGSSAFQDCKKLETVTFEENSKLTSIGSYAFVDCSNLTSINIPASVTSIGFWTFSGCTGIIQKENGISYVDKWVIECDTNVTSVTLRSNTAGIGDAAFRSCSGLTSISLPASVTSIDEYAFQWCSGLTSISIPASVTFIGEGAFKGCKGLTSISIPASVTSIGERAFSDCSNLTSVTFKTTTGWWYSDSSSTATSGEGLSASALANTSTAANYLTYIYCGYYWKRS